jgi:hypothetical protein
VSQYTTGEPVMIAAGKGFDVRDPFQATGSPVNAHDVCSGMQRRRVLNYPQESTHPGKLPDSRATPPLKIRRSFRWAAKKVLLPRVAHRQSRYLNNRAENSHQPTRQRERRMKRFKPPEPAQRFLETHDILAAHFRPKRHLLSAVHYRTERQRRFDTWRETVAA